jgi:thioredoxin 1
MGQPPLRISPCPGSQLAEHLEDELAIDLAVRYGIRSIPTILFFKQGAIVDRVVGVAPKALLQDIVIARA